MAWCIMNISNKSGHETLDSGLGTDEIQPSCWHGGNIIYSLVVDKLDIAIYHDRF